MNKFIEPINKLTLPLSLLFFGGSLFLFSLNNSKTANAQLQKVEPHPELFIQHTQNLIPFNHNGHTYLIVQQNNGNSALSKTQILKYNTTIQQWERAEDQIQLPEHF